ncbi:MAG: hypothetical protein JSW53_01015 [Candidatus Bathyarchaeota archaeon]|nr:MAG: hypothetical protein JSW53_01015 [Candidatus Bathyarchaeota archaeon]
MSKNDFDKLLIEAIDDGLASLGESSKDAIYFHLEKGFNVRKSEIPSRIDSFKEAIEGIFGSGARFLETLILTKLHRRIGQNSDGEGKCRSPNFIKGVASAKQKFLRDRGEGILQCC